MVLWSKTNSACKGILTKSENFHASGERIPYKIICLKSETSKTAFIFMFPVMPHLQ